MSTVGLGVGVGSGVGVGVGSGVGCCVARASCTSSVATGAAATGVGDTDERADCAGNIILAQRKPKTSPMRRAMRKHHPHVLRYLALILRSTLRIIAARALLSNKTAP